MFLALLLLADDPALLRQMDGTRVHQDLHVDIDLLRHVVVPHRVTSIAHVLHHLAGDLHRVHVPLQDLLRHLLAEGHALPLSHLLDVIKAETETAAVLLPDDVASPPLRAALAVALHAVIPGDEALVSPALQDVEAQAHPAGTNVARHQGPGLGLDPDLPSHLLHQGVCEAAAKTEPTRNPNGQVPAEVVVDHPLPPTNVPETTRRWT